jgi:hypothetical protein
MIIFWNKNKKNFLIVAIPKMRVTLQGVVQFPLKTLPKHAIIAVLDWSSNIKAKKESGVFMLLWGIRGILPLRLSNDNM